MHLTHIPTPEILKNDVECIRVTEYNGVERLSINVYLNGLPGIVFQHHNGHSPIENITTRFHTVPSTPTLYVYGQMTEPGVMNHKPTSWTTTQVVLKPHALQSLFGLNASELTNSLTELTEFSAGQLNLHMMEAHTQEERLTLIINYLVKKLEEARSRDALVEESLHLIDHSRGSITVKTLLDKLSLSERQFEKRFTQSVGLSPGFYIRVKRFNEAIRLMKTGRFQRLTDVAHALRYYDQSHFIRDIKAFSGITPKDLVQKVDFWADQKVYSHTEK